MFSADDGNSLGGSEDLGFPGLYDVVQPGDLLSNCYPPLPEPPSIIQSEPLRPWCLEPPTEAEIGEVLAQAAEEGFTPRRSRSMSSF